MDVFTHCMDIGSSCVQYTDFNSFIVDIAKTDTERYLLSKLTQQQQSSSAWMRARLFRITSSVCSDIVALLEKPQNVWASKAQDMYERHNKSYNMLLAAPVTRDRTPVPCQWGIDHENEAREIYLTVNKHLHCQQMGIVVSKSGALGASPDGVLYRSKEAAKDPSRWHEGELLEIKCPYKSRQTRGNTDQETRDKVVSELAYLQYNKTNEVELNLKNAQGRKYFHQVQMGMHVLGLRKCHYVIWTPHIIFVFPVHYQSYWDIVAQKLEVFWRKSLMPVLWDNKHHKE